MNEIERLERHSDVLMSTVETNSKKIRQQKLMDRIWDIRRIEATRRILNELVDVAQMINELWEHPECEQIVGT